MSCNCSAKRKLNLSKAALAVQKLRVRCVNCQEDLVGLDSKQYPAHLTPVIVSASQVDAWKNAGYSIQILT